MKTKKKAVVVLPETRRGSMAEFILGMIAAKGWYRKEFKAKDIAPAMIPAVKKKFTASKFKGTHAQWWQSASRRPGGRYQIKVKG